jgi:hypothetical protein
MRVATRGWVDVVLLLLWIVASVLLGLVLGLRVRRHERASELTDGVPDAPIAVNDDEIGHASDGTVLVRQSSTQPSTLVGRLARGSVPPPMVRTLAVVLPRRAREAVDQWVDDPQVELDS